MIFIQDLIKCFFFFFFINCNEYFKKGYIRIMSNRLGRIKCSEFVDVFIYNNLLIETISNAPEFPI